MRIRNAGIPDNQFIAVNMLFSKVVIPIHGAEESY
jgi:hypothetical protein